MGPRIRRRQSGWNDPFYDLLEKNFYFSCLCFHDDDDSHRGDGSIQQTPSSGVIHAPLHKTITQRGRMKKKSRDWKLGTYFSGSPNYVYANAAANTHKNKQQQTIPALPESPLFCPPRNDPCWSNWDERWSMERAPSPQKWHLLTARHHGLTIDWTSHVTFPYPIYICIQQEHHTNKTR